MKLKKFRLKGVKRLREFKEMKVKIELGKILKEMNAYRDRIESSKNVIRDTFGLQEESLKSSNTNSGISFFSYLIDGKRKEIQYCQNMIEALRPKYEEKLQELQKAKGDVKVLENLEENVTKYNKKILLKKEEEKIADIFRMRNKTGANYED